MSFLLPISFVIPNFQFQQLNLLALLCLDVFHTLSKCVVFHTFSQLFKIFKQTKEILLQLSKKATRLSRSNIDAAFSSTPDPSFPDNSFKKKLVEKLFLLPPLLEEAEITIYSWLSTRERESNSGVVRDRFPPLKRKAKFTARNLSFA